MHTRPLMLETFVGGVLVYTRPVPRQFLRILDSSWLNVKFGCFFLSGEGVVAHSPVGVNFFTATR